MLLSRAMLKLLLLVVVILVIVAIKLLPWWGLVAGVVALVAIAKLFGGRIVQRIMVQAFISKGARLRGAQVVVHAVHDEDPPPVEPSPEDSANATPPANVGAPRRHVCIDATITPAREPGAFRLWEPGEMRFVPIDLAPEDPLGDAPADPRAEVAELGAIELLENGTWRTDEGEKFEGPMRVRFHVAVAPGVDRLKFRYYFEDFGEVVLPGATGWRNGL